MPGPPTPIRARILVFGNTDLNVTGNNITGTNDDTRRQGGRHLRPRFRPAQQRRLDHRQHHLLRRAGIDVTGDVTPKGILIDEQQRHRYRHRPIRTRPASFRADRPRFATLHDVDGTDGDDILAGGAGDDILPASAATTSSPAMAATTISTAAPAPTPPSMTARAAITRSASSPAPAAGSTASPPSPTTSRATATRAPTR